MKALSLIQPYATLIMLGYKHFETRSWPTKHRGQLAIAASAGKPAWAREVCQTDPIISNILEFHGLTFDSLPRGVILGTCEVESMHKMDETWDLVLDDTELACGDYTPGRWAWALKNIIRTNHTPAKGKLGLWDSPLLSATKQMLSPGRAFQVSGHVHKYGGRLVTLIHYHQGEGWLCQTAGMEPFLCQESELL
jgi:hypothetical protein